MGNFEDMRKKGFDYVVLERKLCWWCGSKLIKYSEVVYGCPRCLAYYCLECRDVFNSSDLGCEHIQEVLSPAPANIYPKGAR